MKHLAVIFITLLAFAMTACNDDEPRPGTSGNSRTILVYMIATNSLSSWSDDDIDEMIEGMSKVDNDSCHLVLYEVAYDVEPTLYEIAKVNGSVSKMPLKTYSSDIRSTTTDRMAEVISDTRTLFPSKDYGFVLWSHASGWVRTLEASERQQDSNISSLDYGDDYGDSMSITELADAIPDNAFNFIYADVCYMGCIEIAYQLRNKTQYYISSPTETMANGMPYDENIPCLFGDLNSLTQACQNTYNYYESRGSYATISLTDCSQLDEIAELCRQIHLNPADVTVPIEELQCYNRNTRSVFFDFLQYTQLLATSEQSSALYNLTNQAIIYKAATKRFDTITIDPDNYSGLSTYILETSPINEQYYTTLEWYDKVYN